MNREFLRNIGQKAVESFLQLPYGVRMSILVPAICGIGVGWMVYSGIRGRFDGTYREKLKEETNAELAYRKARDASFDSMSDEEMATYAGNQARQLRFLVLPSLVAGERRDN